MSPGPTDRVAADIASRRLAQSEFTDPVVVVAGAGTGKTALLVARVVVWCVGPGWRRHAEEGRDRQEIARRVIERVVAITFTDAAAAEMARKINDAFMKLAKGELPTGWDPKPEHLPGNPDELCHRARALAEEGHRLVVSTIHAFCQRMLSTYPLEAGIHPRFQVDADGTRIEALAREVVENALRGLAGDPNLGAWERLSAEGVNPEDIVQVLIGLVDAGASSDLLSEDPFAPTNLDAMSARLREILARCQSHVGDRLDGVSGSVSIAAREALSLLERRLGELPADPTVPEFEGFRDGVGDNVIKKYVAWARHDLGKSERRCLDDVIDEAAPDFGELGAALGSMEELRAEELRAALLVVTPLSAELQRRRMEIGLLTFSDLLRFAESLLRGSAGVRRDIVGGIDHLLVDEFQDTDTIQCSIVESLAFSDGASRPSLFIVGDPKQSIYAWRNADLAAYGAFVGRVLAAGGQTIDLVRNFRSVTPVLDEVEALVGPLMREEPGVQPEFQPLEATEERRGARGVDQPPWTTVEHWLAWPRGPKGIAPQGRSDSESTALEAKAIAADIRRLRESEVIDRWGEVAILLRVTTAQSEILEQLRRAGVPYEVASERDYYRQREVVELAALVRCVLEPTDLLALLTVLRSDVVGAPDAALAPVWDAGFAEAMARIDGPHGEAVDGAATIIRTAAPTVRNDLPGGDVLPLWAEAVVDAVEIIAELRRSLREDPPDVFVERIRTRWLPEPTAAARYLGSYRRARIDRFLTDLESTLTGDRVGDSEVARFLRVAVEEGRDSKVPLPPDLEVDAVHVMTIHKAKGLDFEHVYVAQVHKGLRGGGNNAPVELLDIDGKPEYRLFGWATPGFGIADWRRERKARAEQVRLLYVATTRAKRRLVVSGRWTEPNRAKPPEGASGFAQLIGHRLAEGRLEDQRETENPRVVDQVRHITTVLPVLLGEQSEHEHRRTGSDDAPIAPERVRRARMLASDRARASQVMALPYFRSASEEARHKSMRSEVEGGPTGGEGAPDRELSMELGTAIHGILETLDLATDPVPQIVRHRDRLIRGLASGRDHSLVEERVNDLLAELVSGSLLHRLGALSTRVVARELPVVMWRDEDHGHGAVMSGFVDLVYSDPDDDRLVVADYKTDRVESDGEIADRVDTYRPQLETYAAALERALDLGHRPHTELWFLHADRIVRL